MSKVEAVEQVLEGLRLSEEEKWQLTQWLQRERLQREWKVLFAQIDRRVKKYGPPPTEEDIVKLCREVRKERYERTAKGRS